MKLVHAADLHLDSPLRGLERYESAPVERIRGATRRALQHLVELCLAERADVLLLAGDLYDGNWRDYSTGLHFAAQMARLREVGTRVLLVRGNHDAQSVITRHLRHPDHVTELSARAPETRVLEDLGLAVHGQSYDVAAVERDLAAAYPAALPGLFNVGLLHTAVSGAPGHAPYAPCTLGTLADRGYQYWALGHVHQRAVLSTDPWVVFPGNLQGRHVREPGDKGATVVDVEGGRVASVQHRSLDVVRWHVLDIDAGGVDHVDLVRDLAAHALEAAHEAAGGRLVAARVVVRGASAVHAALARDADAVRHDLRALALEFGGDVWLEQVEIATRPLVDRADLARRDDAVGYLARALERAVRDPGDIAPILEDIAGLEAKLPHELRTGPDALELRAPATIERALMRALDGALAELAPEADP